MRRKEEKYRNGSRQIEDSPFTGDEPQAHARYDRMIETLHAAYSLYYESEYRQESGEGELSFGAYRTWMRKPNYARLEGLEGNRVKGVVVLDGEQLWVYWPNGRPYFDPAKLYGQGDRDEEQWKQTRLNVYMTHPALPGEHSIRHWVGFVGGRVIVNPSTFHGYTTSLQSLIDGVRSVGTEHIGDEECDGIEVSFINHQRSWYLWLSRHDHLPRRLKEVIRAHPYLITHELWSNVTVHAQIPLERFAFKPPAGFREWQPASPDEWLLKPKTPAPDFSLVDLGGQRVTLSDFRGRVVCLFFWRVD